MVALGEDETGVTPPEAGYELYRHKNAGDMKTKNWHGLYWARRNKKRQLRGPHGALLRG